jgi:hypothetical protein
LDLVSENKGFFLAFFAPALRSLRLEKIFYRKARKGFRKVRKEIHAFNS